MNGTSRIGGGSLGNPGPSWHVMGSGDYNRDGRPDILWQNASGEVGIWDISGISVVALQFSPAHAPAGTPDLCSVTNAPLTRAHPQFPP
jgi:hypothetical protein